MFRPSDKSFKQMALQCNQIAKNGDEGLSEAWLIWANLYLQIANDLNTHAFTYANQLTPLIGALMRLKIFELHELHEKLKESVFRGLWQAKLNGRNELNIEDARKMITQILSD